MMQVLFLSLAFSAAHVLGSGIAIPISVDQINDARVHNTMNTLFVQQVHAHPIVMFTKSTCSLSRKARELMADNYPNVDYHYYEYDTQPLGVYYMYSSILNSGTRKTPQIYMCEKFIGGTPAFRVIHQNGQIMSTVQNCTVQ